MKNNQYLFLINNENPLPLCYNVDITEIYGGYYIDSFVAYYAKKMLCTSKKCGINLKIESAYRSNKYQQMLIDIDVKTYMNQGYSLEDALAKTLQSIALPGRSEHNTGLALDILSDDYDTLDTGFENTTAFSWLDINAHKFGFILRYPKDKTSITKISYEPWHYRFVGLCHAKRIKKSGLTLEEYIKKTVKNGQRTIFKSV